MTAKRPAAPSSRTSADNLEQVLDRIEAAQKRKLKNEDIVRLEKDGSISYERVRTVAVPRDDSSSDKAARATTNFCTETPVSHENGQQFPASTMDSTTMRESVSNAQVDAATVVSEDAPAGDVATQELAGDAIFIHDAQTGGKKIIGLAQSADAPDNSQNQAATSDDKSADPLDELMARALSRPRRGRPATFDEHNKGKLVALLSLGMSLRQSAAVLGVSHGTIRNTLKADPALAEEINAARFQAQLQPLACVIREARRSWKAATWLLKYLDSKITQHEETPDERRDRENRERDEFFSRPIPKRRET